MLKVGLDSVSKPTNSERRMSRPACSKAPGVFGRKIRSSGSPWNGSSKAVSALVGAISLTSDVRSRPFALSSETPTETDSRNVSTPLGCGRFAVLERTLSTWSGAQVLGRRFGWSFSAGSHCGRWRARKALGGLPSAWSAELGAGMFTAVTGCERHGD